MGIPKGFRPMLAASLPTGANIDLEKLDYSRGFFASPKVDGIRGVKFPNNPIVSRTLKPIRNQYIRSRLSWPGFDWFDGELILGRLEDGIDYNSSQSAIMSEAGEPFFTYCVFDDVEYAGNRFHWRNDRARKRIEELRKLLAEQGPQNAGFDVVYLEQKFCPDKESILRYEEEQLAKGFEGIIIRDLGIGYKYNRSTFKQQGMIKLKRFGDGEAVIEGFEELQLNQNEPVRDALGYQKRSSHKAGMVGAGTLGLLQVRALNTRFAGVQFEIGSGLDDYLRQKIWDSRDKYLGRIVKYKYQDFGSKVKPRSPIFLGFRDPSDMDVPQWANIAPSQPSQP